MIINTPEVSISVYKDKITTPKQELCLLIENKESGLFDSVFLPYNRKTLEAVMSFASIMKREEKKYDPLRDAFGDVAKALSEINIRG